MAKVKYPLHSTKATGRLAKSLIFRETKKIAHVTGFYFPGSKIKRKPSTAQSTQRNSYKKKVESWNQLSYEEKCYWLKDAKNKHYNKYNAYIKNPILINNYAILGESWLGLSTLGNEPA
ncbi:MAG: hypothetical protein J7J61_07430 [Candidatus Hydrothermae bacterium]|nr:hypothetical protein [Candidatus Hydrothermae bacterium]